MTFTDEILTEPVLGHIAGEWLIRLREKRPLVQNITNFVAMDISANALLAIGASPAMVHAVEEVQDFLAFSDALVINTGTLSAPFAASMKLAAARADSLGKPWVLDPVGAGATAFRNQLIGELLGFRPSIIRGNASEILSVARIAALSDIAAVPKGVDSQHATAMAESAAVALARQTGGVVAATGAVDFITDGTREFRLANGDAMMTRITALGCSLSAVCAAFASLSDDFCTAAASAIGVYGVAGEIAALASYGPGSFRTAFLDALYNLTPADLTARLKVLQ